MNNYINIWVFLCSSNQAVGLQVQVFSRKKKTSCLFGDRTRVFGCCRSIQKLEELNVGMENLGEEVKSLTQQCNGNGNTPASEDNNNPPSVTPEQSRTQGGGVLSSTPQRTVGGRPVPPPNESPVATMRFVWVCFCLFFVFKPACWITGPCFLFVCFLQWAKTKRRPTRWLSRLFIPN